LGHYERIKNLPGDSPYKKYYFTGMGYKYRISPLAAALSDSAFDGFDEKNEIRNSNARYLEYGLKDIECINPQKVYNGAVRQFAYHYATYDAEKLEGVSLVTFLNALKAEGLMCGPCSYGRLHKAPLFVEGTPYGKGCPGNCPNAASDYDRKNVSLPVSEYLAASTFMMAPRFERVCRDLVDQYIEAYHKVVNNIDELKQLEKESSK
jgi:dTDP-4-amino-4,6-dideoxygalactose transaminase